MWTALYTFHAYRSWMPDEKQGYVQHGESEVRDRNEALANYRVNNANGDRVEWGKRHQALMVDEMHHNTEIYHGRLHAIIVNPSHAHILFSAPDTREPEKLGSAIKRSFTKALNAEFGKPEVSWFTRKFHWKMIDQEEHFDVLIRSYLPQHRDQQATIWFDPVYKIEW